MASLNCDSLLLPEKDPSPVDSHKKQRKELTFKFNSDLGRHGWLRLTPAYSVKVVDEILCSVENKDTIVFDPFSGTGTTVLCATNRGFSGFSTDINPFLVWLGNAKLKTYSKTSLSKLLSLGNVVEKSALTKNSTKVPPPPIHNIERWWGNAELDFLCGLRAGIVNETKDNSPERTLLDIAFCRTMIRLSNAAFNHQSMSFKKQDTAVLPGLYEEESRFDGSFMTDLEHVVATAKVNPTGQGKILLDDARLLKELNGHKFDLLVTSPPYPNRMSYIRELRPYMYWLGFLDKACEAADLDWEAIGGTWGSATSRLLKWGKSEDSFSPVNLADIVVNIENGSDTSGRLLAKYVEKYFSDIWEHCQAVFPLIRSSGSVNYIVGNSKFYDVIVPVEKIYAAMLERVGFIDVEIVPIRKRNSKKELFEYLVRGKRPG